jgi:transcription-repair coupling factor (superfamily II helicase)
MTVAHLRTISKNYGLTEVVLAGKFLRISPLVLAESSQLRLQRIYPGSLIKAANSTVLVARNTTPNWIGEQEIGDTSALSWAIEVVHSIVSPNK